MKYLNSSFLKIAVYLSIILFNSKKLCVVGSVYLDYKKELYLLNPVLHGVFVFKREVLSPADALAKFQKGRDHLNVFLRFIKQKKLESSATGNLVQEKVNAANNIIKELLESNASSKIEFLSGLDLQEKNTDMVVILNQFEKCRKEIQLKISDDLPNKADEKDIEKIKNLLLSQLQLYSDLGKGLFSALPMDFSDIEKIIRYEILATLRDYKSLNSDSGLKKLGVKTVISTDNLFFIKEKLDEVIEPLYALPAQYYTLLEKLEKVVTNLSNLLEENDQALSIYEFFLDGMFAKGLGDLFDDLVECLVLIESLKSKGSNLLFEENLLNKTKKSIYDLMNDSSIRMKILSSEQEESFLETVVKDSAEVTTFLDQYKTVPIKDGPLFKSTAQKEDETIRQEDTNFEEESFSEQPEITPEQSPDQVLESEDERIEEQVSKKDLNESSQPQKKTELKKQPLKESFKKNTSKNTVFEKQKNIKKDELNNPLDPNVSQSSSVPESLAEEQGSQQASDIEYVDSVYTEEEMPTDESFVETAVEEMPEENQEETFYQEESADGEAYQEVLPDQEEEIAYEEDVSPEDSLANNISRSEVDVKKEVDIKKNEPKVDSFKKEPSPKEDKKTSEDRSEDRSIVDAKEKAIAPKKENENLPAVELKKQEEPKAVVDDSLKKEFSQPEKVNFKNEINNEPIEKKSDEKKLSTEESSKINNESKEAKQEPFLKKEESLNKPIENSSNKTSDATDLESELNSLLNKTTTSESNQAKPSSLINKKETSDLEMVTNKELVDDKLAKEQTPSETIVDKKVEQKNDVDAVSQNNNKSEESVKQNTSEIKPSPRVPKVKTASSTDESNKPKSLWERLRAKGGAASSK